jgi:elongator complex protein 3
MLKAVPRYCRVMRVMREIPPEYIVAGTKRIDLRKDVEIELRNRKKSISEIRFREIGFAMRHGEVNSDLKLKVTKYNASNGDEYFLEIVNKHDILFGLLRLRICEDYIAPPSKHPNHHPLTVNSLKKSRVKRGKLAIIRELHVYGQALKLGEEGKIGQHTGLGKWLMNEAEKIVKKAGIKKISVISGVGVRPYYRPLGYELEESYMVKEI